VPLPLPLCPSRAQWHRLSHPQLHNTHTDHELKGCTFEGIHPNDNESFSHPFLCHECISFIKEAPCQLKAVRDGVLLKVGAVGVPEQQQQQQQHSRSSSSSSSSSDGGAVGCCSSSSDGGAVACCSSCSPVCQAVAFHCRWNGTCNDCEKSVQWHSSSRCCCCCCCCYWWWWW